jgi:hypothetical protein
MSTQNGDPLWRVAEQVADCLSERGYAFVDDDKLESLAAALRSFLTATGIPVNAVDARGEAPTAIGNSSASSPSGHSGPLQASLHPVRSTAR